MKLTISCLLLTLILTGCYTRADIVRLDHSLAVEVDTRRQNEQIILDEIGEMDQRIKRVEGAVARDSSCYKCSDLGAAGYCKKVVCK